MLVLRNVVLVAALAAAMLAAAPPPTGAATTLGVWHMSTSSLDYNFKTGDFSAPQRVELTRVGGDITADRADGNFRRQIETLYGDVVMHDMNGTFGGVIGSGTPQSHAPSTLTTDQLRIDGSARIYTATGHVHYVQESTTVDADRAMLNDASHMLYLSGHARVSQGLRSLVAEHITYDTATGQARAEGNVTVEFPSTVQPHIATPKPIRVPGVHRTPAPR
jgi:lipopolysaccharide assembly outer membrane protein LptD (OstA)